MRVCVLAGEWIAHRGPQPRREGGKARQARQGSLLVLARDPGRRASQGAAQLPRAERCSSSHGLTCQRGRHRRLFGPATRGKPARRLRGSVPDVPRHARDQGPRSRHAPENRAAGPSGRAAVALARRAVDGRGEGQGLKERCLLAPGQRTAYMSYRTSGTLRCSSPMPTHTSLLAHRYVGCAVWKRGVIRNGVPSGGSCPSSMV